MCGVSYFWGIDAFVDYQKKAYLSILEEIENQNLTFKSNSIPNRVISASTDQEVFNTFIHEINQPQYQNLDVFQNRVTCDSQFLKKEIEAIPTQLMLQLDQVLALNSFVVDTAQHQTQLDSVISALYMTSYALLNFSHYDAFQSDTSLALKRIQQFENLKNISLQFHAYNNYGMVTSIENVLIERALKQDDYHWTDSQYLYILSIISKQETQIHTNLYNNILNLFKTDYAYFTDSIPDAISFNRFEPISEYLPIIYRVLPQGISQALFISSITQTYKMYLQTLQIIQTQFNAQSNPPFIHYNIMNLYLIPHYILITDITPVLHNHFILIYETRYLQYYLREILDEKTNDIAKTNPWWREIRPNMCNDEKSRLIRQHSHVETISIP